MSARAAESARSRSRRSAPTRSRWSTISHSVVAGSLYVAVMVVLSAVAAWPIYRGWSFIVLVSAAVVVATAIAGVAHWRRWNGWLVAGALAVALFVLGVAFAVPSRVAEGTSRCASRFCGCRHGRGVRLQGPADRRSSGGRLSQPARAGAGRLLGGHVRCSPAGLARGTAGLCGCRRHDRDAVVRAVLRSHLGLGAPRRWARSRSPHLSRPRWASVGWWRACSGSRGARREERVRALQRATASSGVRLNRRPSQTDRRRRALGAGMIAVAVVATVAIVPAVAADRDRDVLRAAAGPELEMSRAVSPLAAYRGLFAPIAPTTCCSR